MTARDCGIGWLQEVSCTGEGGGGGGHPLLAPSKVTGSLRDVGDLNPLLPARTTSAGVISMRRLIRPGSGHAGQLEGWLHTAAQLGQES